MTAKINQPKCAINVKVFTFYVVKLYCAKCCPLEVWVYNYKLKVYHFKRWKRFFDYFIIIIKNANKYIILTGFPAPGALVIKKKAKAFNLKPDNPDVYIEFLSRRRDWSASFKCRNSFCLGLNVWILRRFILKSCDVGKISSPDFAFYGFTSNFGP